MDLCHYYSHPPRRLLSLRARYTIDLALSTAVAADPPAPRIALPPGCDPVQPGQPGPLGPACTSIGTPEMSKHQYIHLL